MVIHIWTASKQMLIRSSCWILATHFAVQNFPDVFGWNFGKFICLWFAVLKQGNSMKNPAMIECGSSSSSRSTFLFIWWGRSEDLKPVQMSLNLYQGTTTTHTTLQVLKSEFIWLDSFRDIGQSRNYHTKSCSGRIRSLWAGLPKRFWRQLAGHEWRRLEDFNLKRTFHTQLEDLQKHPSHKNSYKAVDCCSFKLS